MKIAGLDYVKELSFVLGLFKRLVFGQKYRKIKFSAPTQSEGGAEFAFSWDVIDVDINGLRDFHVAHWQKVGAHRRGQLSIWVCRT